MSEQPSMSQQQNPQGGSPKRGRRWLFAVIIGTAALFGFAAGNVHSAPWWHWAGHHHLDADEISFIVQHRIDRALTKVDATQDQRDKIHAIAKSAINDVMAMRKDQSEGPEKFFAIMKADAVDRSALESLRTEKLGMADAASKRILQAVADAADVLKPEQRRQLADAWQQHHMHP